MKLRNPFPGIRPFAEDEGEFFFGRDHQISELITKLNAGSFVAVVGTSGCGKSSLVRAGLIPRLLNDQWHVAIFRPQDPLENLRLALENIPYEFGEEDSREEFKEIWTGMIPDNLLSTSSGIIETYKQSGSEKKLIIVVDQFEELFAYQKKSDDNREHAIQFINLLIQAVRQKEFPIHILLTLRSDQLGRCSEFKGLPELINDGLFLVPRLTRDQYRDAIIKPLLIQQIKIASNLVSQLLNDIEDDPDQLPVLQHSLMLTFDGWIEKAKGPDFAIELSDYLAAGGMAQSIDTHCNRILEKLKTQNFALPTEIIFQRLTEINAEGVETRCPTTLSNLVDLTSIKEEEVVAILNDFRIEGRNFLTPPIDVKLTGQTLIDLSHECIMRKWHTLHRWILKEEENKRFLQRLLEHFRNYTQGERGPLKNPTLAAYKSWEKFQKRDKSAVTHWATRYSDRFRFATDFVKASIRWDNQRKRIRALLLLAVPIIVVVTTLYVAEKMHESEVKTRKYELAELDKEEQAKRAELSRLNAEIAKDSVVILRSINVALQQENLDFTGQLEHLNSLLKEETEGKYKNRKLSSVIDSMTKAAAISRARIEALSQDKATLNRTLNEIKKSKSDSVRMMRDLYLAELKDNQTLLKNLEEKVEDAQKSKKIDEQSARLFASYISELKKVVVIPPEPTEPSALGSLNEHTIKIYTKSSGGKNRVKNFKDFLESKGYNGRIIEDEQHDSFYKKMSGKILVVSKSDKFINRLKEAMKGSSYESYAIKKVDDWNKNKPANEQTIIVLDFD